MISGRPAFIRARSSCRATASTAHQPTKSGCRTSLSGIAPEPVGTLSILAVRSCPTIALYHGLSKPLRSPQSVFCYIIRQPKRMLAAYLPARRKRRASTMLHRYLRPFTRSFRVFGLFVLPAVVVGVVVATGNSFAAAPSATLNRVADVRACGAVGDGKTDDTAAFKCAIAESTAWKVPVYVPWGTYRITDTLTLTDQLMTGQFGGSYTSDSATLPTIKATNPSRSAIRLESGGAVSGLNFDYPQDESSATPTPYATTILL